MGIDAQVGTCLTVTVTTKEKILRFEVVFTALYSNRRADGCYSSCCCPMPTTLGV